MDLRDLAQMSTCGHSDGSKPLERNGRVEWGDSPKIVKRFPGRQAARDNFFNQGARLLQNS
jgi:hypothetical protein